MIGKLACEAPFSTETKLKVITASLQHGSSHVHYFLDHMDSRSVVDYVSVPEIAGN
jgi:hypothetical protein